MVGNISNLTKDIKNIIIQKRDQQQMLWPFTCITKRQKIYWFNMLKLLKKIAGHAIIIVAACIVKGFLRWLSGKE